MNSCALWCEKKTLITEAVEISAKIHFNLWTEYDGDDKAPFLDIGIMIGPLISLETINFYLPFKINTQDVKDLGKTLSSNKEVLNAVFNENYTIEDNQTLKQVKVLDETNTPIFAIYSLDIASNVKFEENYDGTIIKINMQNMRIDLDKYYFRFRVCSDNLKGFIQKRLARNWLLQSATSSNYFIDFRFNDKRSLNTSLLEYIGKEENAKVVIDKVHFLLLTRADVELVTKNASLSERRLEKHIWEKYLGHEPKEMIVANHWRLADNNYVVYIKFNVNKCNIRTILLYLVVLLLITLFFNLLSAIIFEWIKTWFPHIVPIVNNLV